jgi:outer membrane protein
MRKVMFLIIATLLVPFSVQAAEVKIGFIDLQKIVTTSDQGREAMKTLDSIEKAKNALMKDKVDEIRKLEEEIAKQGAILTPETKQKKQMEYEKLMMEFQKMRQERDAEVKKNETVFIQKIVMDVQKILDEIAKKEGYTAILNEAAVVYMPDDFNLTDRVMKKYNESSMKTSE